MLVHSDAKGRVVFSAVWIGRTKILCQKLARVWMEEIGGRYVELCVDMVRTHWWRLARKTLPMCSRTTLAEHRPLAVSVNSVLLISPQTGKGCFASICAWGGQGVDSVYIHKGEHLSIFCIIPTSILGVCSIVLYRLYRFYLESQDVSGRAASFCFPRREYSCFE